MSVAAAAVVRIVPTFTIGTQSRMQNVYHCRHTTGSGQADEDVVDAAVEFVEELMGNFTSNIHQGVDLESVDVYELVGTEFQPVGTGSSTWVGTNSNDRLPSGIALLIKLYKERTGHADRKYIGGFTEVALAADAWASGVLTNGAAFVADMVAEFTATNGVKLQPSYFNRMTGLVKDYIGGAAQEVISYQRRRKPGVGLT
jgi:hypothetical protein